MAYDLLRVGRTLGLDNFSQLKGLVRGLSSSEESVVKAKFNFNKKALSVMDEFVGSIAPEMKEKQSMLYSLNETFFPRLLNDSSETILDVLLKRFGPKAGRIELKAMTKDDSGIVGNSVIQAARSNNLFSVMAKAHVGHSSLSLSGIFDSAKKSVKDLENLLKKVIYKETKDGRTKLSANAENIGMVRYMDAEIVAPTQYLNDVTKMVTGKSLKEKIASVK